MSETWKEKVDAAYDMVHALCQPRGSEGSREWIMSIPARPDYDPDLVITSGLKAAAKEISTLTAEVDEWKAIAQAEVATNVELRDKLAELQRRLDAVVKMLEPKKPMPQHEDFHPFDIDQWNDAVCDWHRKIDIHARACAIAEGRTE